MPKIIQNFATNKKLVEELRSRADVEYERYKNDRRAMSIEQQMLVADGMYKAFQNRGLADQEFQKATGQDSETETPIANYGSGRFHRIVSQKAGQLTAIANTSAVPWKYKPTDNPSVWASAAEAQFQTDIHNTLAGFTWKSDGCRERMHDASTMIFKYSNCPVLVYWRQEVSRRKVRDPKTGKAEWKDVLVFECPSWKVLHWSMLYADAYGGPIEKQRMVVLVSVVPWLEIQNGLKNKWYDEKQVAIIQKDRKKYRWDGAEGSTVRKEQAANAGQTYAPGESDLYLMFDILSWEPVKVDKKTASFDEEADYTLWWHTLVGNTLKSATSIRLETNIDPDNEIPIRMLHALPDDMDQLYHLTHAQLVRDKYSIESSLWNHLLDNCHGLNRPMTFYDPSAFVVPPADFRYKAGTVHAVNNINNAFKELAPHDITQQLGLIIKSVQDEQVSTIGGNANMMGEAFGGRTPASESIQINRYSQQPQLAEAGYIAQQLFRFLARKFASYWQAYGEPAHVQLIADAVLKQDVYAPITKELNESKSFAIYGSFDTEIDILDETPEDYVQAGQEIDLFRAVAPYLQQMKSSRKKVDPIEWLSDILRRRKVKNVDGFIIPVGDTDARSMQNHELQLMQSTGKSVPINEGEDDEIHIAVCVAEEQRLIALVQADPATLDANGKAMVEAATHYINNLVVPHRKQHEARLAGGANGTQGSAEGRPAPGGAGQQTEGQMAGDAGGSPLAALAGGGNNG